MTVQASSLTDQSGFTIALAGQPNTGKTTVFNQLTGARQHVGNWPGKTVEQKTGSFTHEGTTYRVVDLPGTYSLTANSLEEMISRDFIIDETPDVVVVLVDAAQLERTMYLLAEVLPLPSPVIVALNMMDIAEQEGRSINVATLQEKIGVPIVPMVAAYKEGITTLIETIQDCIKYKELDSSPILPLVGETERNLLAQIKDLIPADTTLSTDWVALKLLEGDSDVLQQIQASLPAERWRALEKILNQHEDGFLAVADARYNWIQQVTRGAVSKSAESAAEVRRGKFDRIATHPIWGIPLAILIMIAAFATAMIIVMPVFPLLSGGGLNVLINATRTALEGAPPWFVSMLADGLIPGVGMGAAFLLFLFAMFLVIGFVEDIGYLARAAFVGDRFMSRLGLHGKSFLPMLTSLGCNVAGVLGSRVVDTWQQRMMTMVMAPIVPCLAVWGVVGFFATIFFGTSAPLVTVALLITLSIWLMFTGLLFKRFIIKDEPVGLLMELPPYHKPNWKTIWRFTWGHTKAFIVRGMTLVAGASMVIWALSYLPHGDIETSILGTLGRFIEPVGAVIGLDWRLMVALLASMASKEASLATLGVLYGLSSGVGTNSLTGLIFGAEAIEHTVIATAIHTSVSPASALAFVFAAFFSVPCLGTIGAIYSESKSWKWTLGATTYYTFAALFAGFLAYQVGSLFL